MRTITVSIKEISFFFCDISFFNAFAKFKRVLHNFAGDDIAELGLHDWLSLRGAHAIGPDHLKRLFVHEDNCPQFHIIKIHAVEFKEPQMAKEPYGGRVLTQWLPCAGAWGKTQCEH
jgi:hypothetical protein